MRLGTAHIVAVQLVFEYAAAKVHDDLLGAATPPETAGVTIHAAKTQNLEILVERIAVAIETDKSEYGIRNGLRD